MCELTLYPPFSFLEREMNDQYLLIDACNVIQATESLKEILQRKNMSAARDELAEIVRDIHDAEGVRVALILDSQNEHSQVEHPDEINTFEFIYAPAGLTADGVIERMVRQMKNPTNVSVVSNDNLVREATRSSGANALRPAELFEWARNCKCQLQEDASRRLRSNAADFRNSLNIDLNP